MSVAASEMAGEAAVTAPRGEGVTGADGGGMHALPSATVRLLGSAQVITSVVSVVKELVENSLDAGATAIDVKLENYGFDKIEVRDNGRGVQVADMQYMGQPHYTSKLRSTDDLNALLTYGFRGEALGSLCAVSSVEVTTKTAADAISMVYSISQHGTVTRSKPSHLPQGTTVCATGLFRNLPVRRQYYSGLKKRREELRRVEDMMTAFGVVQPDVRLALKHNKDTVYQKSALADHRGALLSVWGTAALSNMAHIKRKCLDPQFDVEVFVPARSCDGQVTSRATNDRCYVFVNHRPVVAKEIEKVLRSYYDRLSGEGGRYPLAFVHLTLPPGELDVNLDPNKNRVLIHKQTEVLEFLDKELKILGGFDTSPVADSKNVASNRQFTSKSTTSSTESNDKENMSHLGNHIEYREVGYSQKPVVSSHELVSDRLLEDSSSSAAGVSEFTKPTTIIDKTNSFSTEQNHNNAENSPPHVDESSLFSRPSSSFLAGNVASVDHTKSLTKEIDFDLWDQDDDLDFLVTSTPAFNVDTPERASTSSDRAPIRREEPHSQSDGSFSASKTENVSHSNSTLTTTCSNLHNSANHQNSHLSRTSECFEDSVFPVSGSTSRDESAKNDTVQADPEGGLSIKLGNGLPADNTGSVSLENSMGNPDGGLGWTKGTDSIGETHAQPVTLLYPGKGSNKTTAETTSTPQPPGQPRIYDLVGESAVKRPTSAYIFFSSEIRPQVIAENPGASFQDVARLIGQRWGQLTSDQKQKYEQLMTHDVQRYRQQVAASQGSTPRLSLSSAHKRKKLQNSMCSPNIKNLFKNTPKRRRRPSSKSGLPEVTVAASLTHIKEKMKGVRSQSQDKTGFHLIGQLRSHGLWIGIHGDQLFAFQPIRAQETLAYQRLMSEHVLPADPLPQALTLTDSSLSCPQLHQTLQSLPVSAPAPLSPHPRLTDPRLTSNGFHIQRTAGNSQMLEVVSMASCMKFYGLSDLREVVEQISASPQCDLAATRPLKVKHYLQGESVRMCRQMPLCFHSDDTRDLLQKVKASIESGAPLCLHRKPFYVKLFDLCDLPVSQCDVTSSQDMNSQMCE